MTASAAAIPSLDAIRALLADHGYEVTEAGTNVLNVREVSSGVALQAVLEGGILFFTLNCTVVPESKVTTAVMRRMLDAGNGISTSYFQIYSAGAGSLAVTLNNFCKLQDMKSDDTDDILSCVNFLLVDVMAARRLLGELLA
jgi:hypothetical protein